MGQRQTSEEHQLYSVFLILLILYILYLLLKAKLKVYTEQNEYRILHALSNSDVRF